VAAQVAEVDKKKASFGDIAPKVEKFTKEKAKIDKQLEVIRELSRNRLRGVKALDSLQSLIPSQVWFDDIAIDGDHVIASGFSNTDEGITTLYSALNNSPVFSQFTPRDQVETVVNEIRVKRFQVEFRIGRQEKE
jgi:Tfp pilus assembly protein PilN